MSEHSSVFDPSILHWVTATFVLTIATQIISTVLIAGRIYAASRPFSIPSTRSVNSDQTPAPSHKSSGKGSGKTLNNREGGDTMDGQRAKYLSLVFIVAESGAVYTSAALIQLITYLLNMNAGVILELMLAQLSVCPPTLCLFWSLTRIFSRSNRRSSPWLSSSAWVSGWRTTALQAVAIKFMRMHRAMVIVKRRTATTVPRSISCRHSTLSEAIPHTLSTVMVKVTWSEV